MDQCLLSSCVKAWNCNVLEESPMNPSEHLPITVTFSTASVVHNNAETFKHIKINWDKLQSSNEVMEKHTIRLENKLCMVYDNMRNEEHISNTM